MSRLKIILILFSFLTGYSAIAQQFDWQYSSRLPMDYPTFFLGVNANIALISNSGNINFSEGEVMDCCSFSSGLGWSNDYGITAEYWRHGDLAFFAKVAYSMNDNTFTKQRQGEIRISDTLFYENELISQTDYIQLEIGGRKKIFNSHFYIGAGIAFSYLLKNNNQIIERVLYPEYFPWKERVVSEGSISNLNKAYFYPTIHLGYDIDLWLGTYATTGIVIGIPVQNVTKDAEWRAWHFSFETSIRWGVF